MRWIWDAAKNKANKSRHSLSFDVAQLVFDDTFAASRRDPHVGEERWQTIGSIGSVIVFVVHTWPELSSTGEEVGRMISARKATKHERRVYEEEMF